MIPSALRSAISGRGSGFLAYVELECRILNDPHALQWSGEGADKANAAISANASAVLVG